MRSTINVVGPGCEELISSASVPAEHACDVVTALEWALYHGPLRGVYLQRYQLDPGPVCLTAARPPIGIRYSPTTYASVQVVQLGVLRQGEDCTWEVDPLTVRQLRVELRQDHGPE